MSACVSDETSVADVLGKSCGSDAALDLASKSHAECQKVNESRTTVNDVREAAAQAMELPSLLTSEAMRRPSHGNVMFLPGDDVTLHLLKSRPDLNGKRGTVLGLDGQTGRYKVRIGASEAIKVKPECLEPVLDE